MNHHEHDHHDGLSPSHRFEKFHGKAHAGEFMNYSSVTKKFFWSTLVVVVSTFYIHMRQYEKVVERPIRYPTKAVSRA